MEGGSGNDTYMVDDASDVIVENAGEGTDVVIASSNYTLTANVGNGILTTKASSLTLTGNNLDNTLSILPEPGPEAGFGHTLNGGTGADKLFGGQGNDILIGGNDNDRNLLSGGAGTDTYFANNNDVITDSDGRGWVKRCRAQHSLHRGFTTTSHMEIARTARGVVGFRA